MKKSVSIKYASVMIMLLAIIVSSSAFVLSKNDPSRSGEAVKLTYNMAIGKSLAYSSVTAVSQNMDINGQTMNVLVDNNLGFKIKMLGKVDDNLKFEVTVDSLTTKVDSPNGSTGGKIKDVEGKVFNMIISPLGKEIDVSEAAKIEYSVEGSGNGNLSQSFANIFPDLPEKPINQGDTWTKDDSVINKSAVAKSSLKFQATSKFEGVEKINGMECAKITSSLTGTMATTAQNQGMDIFYSGPYQATVTVYFAVKEGYFVSQETSSKMTGTVEISGPQSMSFPVVMDTRSKIEVKK